MKRRDKVVRAFRQLMAERGTELTLAEARRQYDGVMSLIKYAKKTSVSKLLQEVSEHCGEDDKKTDEFVDLFMRAKVL